MLSLDWQYFQYFIDIYGEHDLKHGRAKMKPRNLTAAAAYGMARGTGTHL